MLGDLGRILGANDAMLPEAEEFRLRGRLILENTGILLLKALVHGWTSGGMPAGVGVYALLMVRPPPAEQGYQSGEFLRRRKICCRR
jgi:hypothetical protein